LAQRRAARSTGPAAFEHSTTTGIEAIMIKHALKFAFWLVGAWLAAAISTAHAWTIIDLGNLVNPNGLTSGLAQGLRINNVGTVVGASETTSGQLHGYIWRQSTGMLDLGTLGGDWSLALGVDDFGYVVGGAKQALVYPVSGNYRAFITSVNGGSMSSLGTFNGKGTKATGISADGSRRVIGHTVETSGGDSYNNGFISAPNGGALSLLPKPPGMAHCRPYGIGVGGRIAGICDCEISCRAYISYNYGAGATSLLSTPQGSKSRAFNVNANYVVGGVTTPPAIERPVRWIQFSPGPALANLALPAGATGGVASAINTSNQIVGRVNGPPPGFYGNGRAALWQNNGTVVVLDQLPEVQAAGWVQLYQAFDINDSGWIVGIGSIANTGGTRAFLLRP
jgi:probable HAF family extracellular repeat protein